MVEILDAYSRLPSARPDVGDCARAIVAAPHVREAGLQLGRRNEQVALVPDVPAPVGRAISTRWLMTMASSGQASSHRPQNMQRDMSMSKTSG